MGLEFVRNTLTFHLNQQVETTPLIPSQTAMTTVICEVRNICNVQFGCNRVSSDTTIDGSLSGFLGGMIGIGLGLGKQVVGSR